ncbi:MAG TPA: ABC transporter ATP-binding protein [Beijerinckiaceae bacterium]|jgi:NitT/TauT family transport system ATP-binding protein|nr:ABC transporter ATP-binding protein [Beijerinckiaceae bacterium]
MRDIIELRNVSLSFGQETVYRDLSFSVRDGEFLCILGPSGCGKSTLLRIVGDLLEVDLGHVIVDGRPPREAWGEMAFVFQSPRLLPWRNAQDNVVLGQQLRFARRFSKAEMRDRARDLLDLVGLGRDMHKMPSMLSGGERQRVAIARALAVDPRIVLMDEPFSALDLNTRRRMRAEIVDIWRKTGKTIVFVTHEIDEAIELADRIVVLSHKPTIVREVIGVDEARPRDMATPTMQSFRQKLVGLLGESVEADISAH